jgi:hypothetical protein
MDGVQVGSVAAGDTYTGYSVPNVLVGGVPSIAVCGLAGGTTRLPAGTKIDDPRVYNRALSAQEVKQLYDMGR